MSFQKDYPVNVTRRLCGLDPNRQRDVEIEVPAYLWPVALALATPDNDLARAPANGRWPITEPRARALAMAMGCVLPGDRDWLLTASKPKREMQVIADPLFHHRV